MAINKDTKIEFSIGMLFSTIGSIISIFIAFYFMVQKPNNDSIKDYTKEQIEAQQKYLEEKFKNIDEKLGSFSSGLSNLTLQVQALNTRSANNQGGNTSGGFN